MTELALDARVRFMADSELVEGRVHTDFNRDLAVVITDDGHRWLVARDDMALVDAPPAG